MGLWTPIKRQKQVKDIFISYYGQYFEAGIQFEKRLDVRPDTLVYNRKEDPYIFDQAKGKVPEYFTVYFDNVYICGFGADEPQAKIDKEFWTGMRDAYKANKIRLNMGLAKQLQDEQAQAIKEAELEAKKKLDSLPSSTPVQKLAKEAVRKIANAKKGRKSPVTA